MGKKKAETPPRKVPLVRIFLSSPGDVAKERTLARQFIDSELPKFPQFREKVKLELIAWDDPAARIPMLASETPQDAVNAARPRPGNCDIVIVILWSRMGTPLPNSVRKPNREPYLSGTEWEYEDAVHSPRRPRPVVLVYRRTAEPLISLREPKKKEKIKQFKQVEAFFARFGNDDGSPKGGINEYATPGDFKTLLSQHLHEVVLQVLQRFRGEGEARPVVAKSLPTKAEMVQRQHKSMSDSRRIQSIIELANYPLEPLFEEHFIPETFIRELANKVSNPSLILASVREANKLRRDADPHDPNVTLIQQGMLVGPHGVSAYDGWSSVFRQALLNCPRMLAALLMVLPVGNLSSTVSRLGHLEKERDLLLHKLKTYKSSRAQKGVITSRRRDRSTLQ